MHLIQTNLAGNMVNIYNSEDYVCANFDYPDCSALLNINKCFCEPYAQKDLYGKTSIVRFPVNRNELTSYNLQIS